MIALTFSSSASCFPRSTFFPGIELYYSYETCGGVNTFGFMASQINRPVTELASVMETCPQSSRRGLRTEHSQSSIFGKQIVLNFKSVGIILLAKKSEQSKSSPNSLEIPGFLLPLSSEVQS